MERRVLVEEGAPNKGARRRAVAPWSSTTVFLALGWIGLVLTAAALVDYALALYPLRLGSAEWEIGTISQVFFGLPLISLGMAAVWVSGAGGGRRWVLLGVGVAFLAAAMLVASMVVLFTLDVPLALRATTQDVARLGLKKLIVKTLMLGLLFGASYVVAGVLALRQVRESNVREAGS